MIRYEVIQKAKSGNEKAILQIIEFYKKRIKKYSTDEDYTQTAILRVIQGIYNLKNKKS